MTSLIFLLLGVSGSLRDGMFALRRRIVQVSAGEPGLHQDLLWAKYDLLEGSMVQGSIVQGSIVQGSIVQGSIV